MTGFEPAAPSSRTKCATKLRYIPLDAFYEIGSKVSIALI